MTNLHTERRQAIHGFTWVEDLEAYQAATCNLSHGVVPLISPSQIERQARWTHILKWYGLSEVDVVDAAPKWLPTIRKTDLVVALDNIFSGPARFYAEAYGRPFRLLVDNNEGVEHLVSDNSHPSVLFVGLPETFSADFLRYLAQQMSVPWGILTARDIAGFTFVIAKLLAGGVVQNGDWAIINAIDETTQEVATDGRFSQPKPFEREELQALIDEHEWHTLALVAHGEGGHVNLNSIVLCGLIGRMERGLAGEPIGGCRVDGENRRCKRVYNPCTRILSFGGLRTKQLYLFTCTGFVIAGDLYPSSISCILSAAEGYPMSVMATNQVTSIDIQDPGIILGFLRQGVGPGSLLQFNNDLHARKFHTRPYLLFGDPCGPEISWVTPTATGELRPSIGSTLVCVRLDEWPVPGVVRIKTPQLGVRLIMGMNTAAVTLVEPHNGKELRLVDETERWETRKQWFQDIGKRLYRAAWLERAIPRFKVKQLRASPEFQADMIKLIQYRMLLEDCVQGGLRACEFFWRQGIWGEAIDHWVEHCTKNIGLWDLCLAELIRDYLFIFIEDVHSFLTDGFSVSERREGSTCDHCSLPLTEIHFLAPLGDQPDQHQIDCPFCRTGETWGDRGARLLVDLSTCLRPGTTAALNISISNPQVGSPVDIPAGLLVVELVDKGRDCVLFHQIQQVVNGACKLKIPIPANISAELHTLRLAWIQGLEVTFQRRRWPAFRDDVVVPVDPTKNLTFKTGK